MARRFADGVDAATLARAPTLQLSRKDELQRRWLRRICHKNVEPPTRSHPE